MFLKFLQPLQELKNERSLMVVGVLGVDVINRF